MYMAITEGVGDVLDYSNFCRVLPKFITPKM